MSRQPPVWHAGPLHLNRYGLAMGAGLLVGLFVALSEARRKGENEDAFTTAIAISAIAGLAGARLLYVLLNLATYAADPAAIIRIWDGGLSLIGALAGGGPALCLAARSLKLRPAVALDAAAPAMAAGLAIGRVGCDLFGLPTTLPWAVNIAGRWVHPAQAYEIIADSALFLWLWARRRVAPGTAGPRPGAQLARFIGGYALVRFLVEFTREPRGALWLSPAQWAAVAAVAVVLLWLRARGADLAPMAGGSGDLETGVSAETQAPPDLLQRVPAWAWTLAIPVLLALYFALNAGQVPLVRVLQ
ncbi:MAG: prolipoprotein diacylglyceryl transferase [Bacillota bacterium]